MKATGRRQRDQDAFGRALLDYLKEGWADLVVERDDGYIDTGVGVAIYFAPFRDWPSHQRRATRHARGRVLDIGCGAGRHALHLQERGLRVLGIDSSPGAVRVCRARGLRNARVMAIEEIPRGMGPFDTILMMGNNLGLLGGFTRGRRILRRLHEITGDRGRIVAESVDPYRSGSPHHAAYHRWNRRRGRMGGQVRIRVRYRVWSTAWFDYLLMSRPELEKLIEGTGWRLFRAIESVGPVWVAILEKSDRRR